MESPKLSVKGLAWAAGLVWGGAMLIVSLLNLQFSGYGQAFLDVMGSVYLWTPDATTKSALILGGIGFLDGAIAGVLFGFLYNRFSVCCHKKCD